MAELKYKNMEDFLEEFPESLLYFRELNDKPSLDFPIKNIVFFGMGGSGIAPKILSPFLKTNHKFISDYIPDNFVKNKNELYILISYSGNTEETLSALESLPPEQTITISSGGKLKEIAKSKRIKHLSLPEGYLPRTALGFMFSLLSFVLKDHINFEINKLESLSLFLKKHREKFKSIDGICMETAQKIYKRGLVIYTAEPYYSCALRIKAQLNENSKHFVHIDKLPEMNHNEIEGIKNPSEIISKFWILFIKGKYMNKRNLLRIKETHRILERYVIGTTVFEPKGKELLEEIFYTVYFFDYVSLYLSKLNKENPIEIKKIEELKRRLKN